MTTQTKLLPLAFQGYAVEPDPNGRFVQDLGRTYLQILYNDSQNLILNPNPPTVLTPRLTRHLWVPFESGKDVDPSQFYNKELHKPHGAEAGDLKPMLKQLAEEMYYHYLFVNGVFVVDNKSGLVFKLGNTQLPAFVTPVGVYTDKPVTPKSEHGMSLDKFKQAGGRLVAYRAFPAGKYQLKDSKWTPMPEGVEQVGVRPGDEIYASLYPEYSDGVRALVWSLHWLGESPSRLIAGFRPDIRNSDWGALRGRRLNTAGSDQEKNAQSCR